MSKQYIIMYVSGVVTSYYCGYSEKWLCNQWVSCLDSNPKIKVYSSLKDAEKDLWNLRNTRITSHTQNNYGIYEYQPEQVIPAKIGNLVNTDKANVLNGLHFVEVTLRSHSPYCCELINKARNYIKENT